MTEIKRRHSKKKQSRKNSRKGQQNEYTKYQLEKLYLDSCAFSYSAKTVSDRIKQNDVKFGSRIEISLTTAATVNLGLSLELLMKYLLAITGRGVPYTHRLVSLFRQMSEELRNEMSTAYFQHLKVNSPKEDLFRASLKSNTMPENPPRFQIQTLEGFLTYIDQIGAYDRRYSFEVFSQSEWWIRVDIDWWLELTNAFVRVANRLRSQNDEDGPESDFP